MKKFRGELCTEASLRKLEGTEFTLYEVHFGGTHIIAKQRVSKSHKLKPTINDNWMFAGHSIEEDEVGVIIFEVGYHYFSNYWFAYACQRQLLEEEPDA